MGKVFFNLKKNNKGVSLVEVLVTVAMVVIIAGPLINSFLNARSVNSNARVIQNGTIVAQDTAEEFVALPLEQLLAVYNDKLDTDAMATQSGVYIFEDIEVDGANGEKFYVDVKLDSNTYLAGNANSKIEVNNVKLPEMSSLYGSDAVMLYKYYTAEDENLKELFKDKLSQTILDNLYSFSQKRFLSKETNILIQRNYNSTVGKYDYDVSFTMHYYYDSGTEDEEVIVTNGKDDIMLAPSQEHVMYLVCPIFDLCSTNDIYNDVCYASDIINIDFVDNCADEYKDKNVYFYLAEQKAKNLNLSYNTKPQKLRDNKIKVEGSVLSLYDDTASKFKFYTNVGNPDDKGLTYTDKDSGVALYDMTIKVKHKDKVVAEFSATK